ncbi:MAG: hypothetical protein MUQ27_05460 [Acidimicrobiia bacterium]|nr:hypothetical protein [Acidimicrobiia bacterium]
MNPNRDRAVDVRRQAISDQIEGLERLIAAGRDEPHQRQRLTDTRAEFGTRAARSHRCLKAGR